MRVLVHLSSAVRAFEPTAEQLRALSASVPQHELVLAQTDEAFLAALPDADAAVVWRFLPGWYAQAPRLQHVFTPSAGREPLADDPDGRVQRHFGSFQGAIMAESLLAMIGFSNRRLGKALDAQRERRWDRGPYSQTRRLRGQVASFMGYGAIGQHCGRLLSGLGVIVHALRRDVTRPSPAAERIFTPERRLEALSLADHVICVLPGGTETDHFLDAAAFAHMKPSACVYNLGRGNAIDPDALLDALSHGRIAGAFLDVQPEEPLPKSSPLWAAPNLYLTPHAAAISAEYLDLYFHELAAELSQY
jgi:phosphoglycerate dehydrogenase-like enzyme